MAFSAIDESTAVAARSEASVSKDLDPRLGIVVIGRNESRRLHDVLETALSMGPAALAYVDSGSSDDSVNIAKGFGQRVLVEQLDESVPTTAARGRNAGFRRVTAAAPSVEYVQFVDGDCILDEAWPSVASKYLDGHPEVAIVAGRLREERRERNAYHRLADIEWDAPVGIVDSTGGVCMIRADAFEAVRGFDGGVASGEELELALRLAARGYRCARVQAPMASHDIDMDSLADFWRRSVRAGDAYCQGVYLQLSQGHRPRLKPVLSMFAWGAALPVVTLALALPSRGASACFGGAAYGMLWRRVRERVRREKGLSPADASLYASAVVVQKFAGVVGAARFLRERSSRTHRYGRYLGAD